LSVDDEWLAAEYSLSHVADVHCNGEQVLDRRSAVKLDRTFAVKYGTTNFD
jgi:hypothetical protein